MAAPAFGTSGAWNGSSASTKSFAVPASVASGDIIVIPMFIDGSTVTITAMPSGFAHAPNSPRTVNSGGGGNHSVNVVWKRATGADTGTYDFTFSSAVFVEGQAHRFTGCVASGSPWDVTAAADGGVTNSTTTPNVSVTTTGPDELLFFAGTNWSGGAWTPPTGFTEITDNASDLTADYKVQTAAGGSGNVSATCASSDKVGAWLGALIGTTVAGGSTTTEPLVVVQPAKRATVQPATILRNTLADPPVLTTRPYQFVVSRAEKPTPPGPAIVLRNTLADPPVLTTPTPTVVTQPAKPTPPNQAYLSRSSLVDVVATPAATPQALVVTQPAKPTFPGPPLILRSSLFDLPGVQPLVVTAPARVASALPVLLRSTLADPVVLTTPAPLVVTRPAVPVPGFAGMWRSSLVAAPPVVNAASSPTVAGTFASAPATAGAPGAAGVSATDVSTASTAATAASAPSVSGAASTPTVSDG